MPIFVATNLVPKSSGMWPVVEDIYLRGGLRAVADATARDAIYLDANAKNGLKKGMLLVTANDMKIWQYAGLGVWNELKKSLTKTYTFDIPGTIWNIPHNTGSTNFTYTVFDTDGFQVLPNECQMVDANNIRLLFLVEMAGSITVSFNP